MFCRKCGTENKDDANFCKKCGENFKNPKSIISENKPKPIEQTSQEPSNNRIGIFNTTSFSVMPSNLNENLTSIANLSFKDRNYDVFDSTKEQLIAKLREINSNYFFRFIGKSGFKNTRPFIIDIFDEKGQMFTRIKKGFTFLRSNIGVFDSNEQRIGKYREKGLFSTANYEVFDSSNQLVAMFKTNFMGSEFIIKDKQGIDLVKVTRKSKGLLDWSYVVELCPQFKEPELKKLLLPALFCMDIW